MGHRQVGVEDDDVGGEALAVRGDHGDGTATRVLDPLDGRRPVEFDPVGGRGGGHRLRYRVHAADGGIDPGDRVHVRDDGVDRQRLVRRDSGVHRLEGVQPLQAWVFQVRVDLRCEPAQAARGHQPGQVQADEVERGVEVAVDEGAQLVAVEVADEVDVAPQAGRLGGAAGALHLGRHHLDVAMHVDRRAVGEGGPVQRADRPQVEPVLDLLAETVEAVGDQVGHRQHRRPDVEPVAALGDVVDDHPGPAPGYRLALEHRDPPPSAGQAHRGRQPGQSGADHHNVVGGAGDGTEPPSRQPAVRAPRPACGFTRSPGSGRRGGHQVGQDAPGGLVHPGAPPVPAGRPW